MSVALKLCPFCGGKGGEQEHCDPTGDEWSLYGCGVCGVWFEDEADWNKRRPTPATQGVVKAFKSWLGLPAAKAGKGFAMGGHVIWASVAQKFVNEQEAEDLNP